jgi:hypothetical protein
MRTQTGLRLTAAAFATLCGCIDHADSPVGLDPGDDLLATEKRATCPTIDNRSLVENDPTIVTEERFSLQRVFERIASTTPSGYAVPSACDMFDQLFYDYGMGAGEGADPNGYGLKYRTAEMALATTDPFTGDPEGLHFAPAALVDRYDMANAKAGTCGESRIVYWKDRGPVAGKAGIIIELFTSPVYDANGKASCAPVAQFWASLSTESDPAVRAAKLESYYFDGLPGMAFAPVSARGAGWDGAGGQVRSNNFVDSVQWNLREAKYRGRCDAAGVCSAGFTLVDTKNSPSEKLFAGTHANSAAFEHWFISKSVPKLAKATKAVDLSLGNDPSFNAYESISQPQDDDPTSVVYKTAASASLRDKIAAKLVEERTSLTVDNILDRATSATCAGCHRVSKNVDLGGGLVFPSPSGFVHIGELGQLSPALVDEFLPKRRQILQDAVCGRGATPLDGETLGGHGLGEPN